MTEKGRQIPIVCPGHTRPLAELQFLYVQEPSDNTTNSKKLLLASACHDRKPMLRDGTTGDWIGTWVGHKGAVWSCQLDPTGNIAATASGDFSLCVWDAITGKQLYNWAHAQHIVKSCAFSPNSVRLAAAGHEGILRIYNVTTPEVEPVSVSMSSTSSSSGTEDSSKKRIAITKVAWWTNEVVLCGCADGTIRFWKLSQDSSNSEQLLSPLHTLPTSSGAEVRDMELHPTKQILTVAAGNVVYFFDLQTHSLLKSHQMPIHFKEEGGASLHPDGTKFIAGGSDLWVRVFDYETGQELECLKGHHGPIRCLRYSPTGATYATGSEDGTIRLWKTDPEDEQ